MIAVAQQQPVRVQPMNRAMGEAGVTRALQIIRKELDITMALCGRRDIRGIDAEVLDRAPRL